MMTNTYRIKHDPTEIADTCNIGVNTLKRWQSNSPLKAELFDGAYELLMLQAHTYKDILLQISEQKVDDHNRLPTDLGLGCNIEQCPFQIIPLTTIRRWRNEYPMKYLMTLIGYQAMSIKQAMPLSDAMTLCYMNNLSISELTRLCIADPIAVSKIAQKMLTS